MTKDDIGRFKRLKITGESEQENIKSKSVHAEELQNNTYLVGPNGRYSTLSAAYAGITDASPTNRYRLILTGSITDDTRIEPKSHIDVDAIGKPTVEMTHDQGGAGLWFDSVQDATIAPIRWDYNPPSNPGYSPACYIRQDCHQSLRITDPTFIGHDLGDGGSGLICRHHNQAVVNGGTVIGGDGGTGCDGVKVIHNAGTILKNVTAYPGNGGNNCHAWTVADSGNAEITGCTGFIPVGGNGQALNVIDSAAATISGFTGKYQSFRQFVSITGSGSDQVDGGFPLDQNESAVAYTGGFPSFLESINIKIVTPGTSGATVDIGTTDGGSEIASGVPIDGAAESRVCPDFNHVELAEGDSIYFTATDSSAEYNPRYTVGVNLFNHEALILNSKGPVTITNSQFKSPPKSPAGEVGDNAINAKKYALGNCSFERVAASAVGRSDNTLIGTTDDATQDPIRRCAVFGSVSNLTPAN